MSHCGSPPPHSTTFLPPTHSPFLSLFHSHSFHVSPPRTLSPPPFLSVFHVCLTTSSERCSVKQGPVCSQARLVLASSLFTCVPGSCRPALCNSSVLFVLPAWILFILAVDILVLYLSCICPSSNTHIQAHTNTLMDVCAHLC